MQLMRMQLLMMQLMRMQLMRAEPTRKVARSAVGDCKQMSPEEEDAMFM